MLNLYRHPIITVVFTLQSTQTGNGDIEAVQMALSACGGILPNNGNNTDKKIFY